MKNAIVIGATSGIGAQLAKLLSADGYTLGLTGRRVENLENLKNQLVAETHIEYMNVQNADESVKCLDSLINKMGGADMIIICAGTGHENPNLEWELEQDTIKTNVLGTTALIDFATNYFIEKKSGHLVAISSVASLRGSATCPAYNASKAYLSNYMEGIKCKVKKQKLDIAVTDIRPGLVDTAMAKGDGLFWVMPVDVATKQIYRAIKKRKTVAYVTKRWRFVAFILKRLPRSVYYKI